MSFSILPLTTTASRTISCQPPSFVPTSVAMAVTVVLLLFSDRISRRAGARGLLALERLMGLILTAIAVEMLLGGIRQFLLQVK